MFLPLILIAAIVTISCGSSEPASPKETFKTYARALKQKDTATMKLLLSAESIKMLEREAKSQGIPLDDVVKRETLFSETQKFGEIRNEKIEGDKATLEVRVSQDKWETVPFVFEDGQWKIDKKEYADRMIQDILQEQSDVFGDDANRNSQPIQPNP